MRSRKSSDATDHAAASGPIKEMPGRERSVERLFKKLSEGNPLYGLPYSDREFIWATLILIMQGDLVGKGVLDPGLLEEIAAIRRVASDLETLSRRLRDQVFTASMIAAMPEITKGYEELPTVMAKLSRVLTLHLDATGKPGYTEQLVATKALVTISEMLKARTKNYQDLALAELIQHLGLDDDLSEDAIRKRRARLRQDYPVLYQQAKREAQHQISLDGSQM